MRFTFIQWEFSKRGSIALKGFLAGKTGGVRNQRQRTALLYGMCQRNEPGINSNFFLICNQNGQVQYGLARFVCPFSRTWAFYTPCLMLKPAWACCSGIFTATPTERIIRLLRPKPCAKGCPLKNPFRLPAAQSECFPNYRLYRFSCIMR